MTLHLQSLKTRIKQKISKHPKLIIRVSRVVSLFFGLKGFFYRLFKFNHCYIDRTVRIIGLSNLEIGINTVIAAGTWLNINNRKSKTPTLVIGENCFIGNNNFINVGKRVTLGDYCLTASNCSFIGSSHVINDYTRPYIDTGVETNASIIVGANCFFGYDSMVLGDVTIGYGSVIGAKTSILKDIPPLSLVIGNPGRVIKRYSINKKKWVKIQEYNESEEELISEADYISLLRSTERYKFLPISVARSTFGDI